MLEPHSSDSPWAVLVVALGVGLAAVLWGFGRLTRWMLANRGERGQPVGTTGLLGPSPPPRAPDPFRDPEPPATL